MTVTSLQLLEDFVNTLHKHDGRDDEETFGSPAQLASWLDDRGLDGGGATDADLRNAVGLREAMRTLLLANNEVDVSTTAAWAELDAVARRGRVELHFDPEGPALVPDADGVAAGLGQLVVAVQTVVDDGTWSRLKACRSRTCEWAFVDTAKNQSRAWCSMKSCGNREKARLYRSRHVSRTDQPDRS